MNLFTSTENHICLFYYSFDFHFQSKRLKTFRQSYVLFLRLFFSKWIFFTSKSTFRYVCSLFDFIFICKSTCYFSLSLSSFTNQNWSIEILFICDFFLFYSLCERHKKAFYNFALLKEHHIQDEWQRDEQENEEECCELLINFIICSLLPSFVKCIWIFQVLFDIITLPLNNISAIEYKSKFNKSNKRGKQRLKIQINVICIENHHIPFSVQELKRVFVISPLFSSIEKKNEIKEEWEKRKIENGKFSWVFRWGEWMIFVWFFLPSSW